MTTIYQPNDNHVLQMSIDGIRWYRHWPVNHKNMAECLRLCDNPPVNRYFHIVDIDNGKIVYPEKE